MLEGHYAALIAAYGTALLGWFVLSRIVPDVWPSARRVSFERPWLEVGVAILAVVAILAIGQLYLRLGFLPETGRTGPVLAALNQIAIFSPIFVVLLLRGDPLDSVWLGVQRWPTRLLAGVALGVLAGLAYVLLRVDADGPVVVAGRIFQYGHLDQAVQVFLEDVAIAFLFVRMAAAIGPRWSVIVVAVLFAVGHVPALLAGGAPAEELSFLIRDAALGTAIILALQRSRDIVWFWPIHFVLDMTQFDTMIFG